MTATVTGLGFLVGTRQARGGLGTSASRAISAGHLRVRCTSAKLTLSPSPIRSSDRTGAFYPGPAAPGTGHGCGIRYVDRTINHYHRKRYGSMMVPSSPSSSRLNGRPSASRLMRTAEILLKTASGETVAANGFGNHRAST
jgi:hypothetical protein